MDAADVLILILILSLSLSSEESIMFMCNWNAFRDRVRDRVRVVLL